jgi:branched-chain amino acid transport system permease protein
LQTLNTVIQGILLGGLFALFASGLSLAFGVMRIVNVAHGDFIILAGYLALVLVNETHINPFLTLLIVTPAMFALGYVLERGVLQFTLNGGVLPPLLVTFGMSVVIQNGLQQGFSADSQGFQGGGFVTSSITLSPQVAIGWLPLTWFVVSVALLLLLHALFENTAVGRSFRAAADDQETLQLMGIDSRHIYALAFGLALATTAVAAVFLGLYTSFTPTSGPSQLLVAFEAVVIGGLGSLRGTLVGGIVLGIAFTLGEQIAPGWGTLSQHLVFLAVLAFRPTGLFSQQTREA